MAAGVVGLILERGWLRHLYQRFDEQVLVTFGLVYVSVTWSSGFGVRGYRPQCFLAILLVHSPLETTHFQSIELG